MFNTAGLKPPGKLKVSCGFTGRGSRKKVLGECWTAAKQIFVSPVQDGEIDVLSVLVHELLHACLPEGTKHGAAFKQGMKSLGLEGKATATVAGEELKKKLRAIEKTLGPYPHKALDLGASGEKKQTTRLLKMACSNCEFVARVTQKWVSMMNNPKCWCCGADIIPPESEDDEEQED
jgi:hypothetical protein